MIDVRRSPELQAAILTMKTADADVRRAVGTVARGRINPRWRAALERRATRPLDRAIILRGIQSRPGSDRVTLRAATSSRELRGGLVPALQWQGEEFGMTRRRATFQATSPRGRRYTVTRIQGRQFPVRQRQGRVAFDAASEVGTELVGDWVRAIVDVFSDVAEIRGAAA